jgi:arylsulfatase A-like enzyme
MRISRRALLGGLTSPALVSAARNRPNVVFILSDDQRFDTIAALGDPHISTPHLDSIARNGVSFSRAHIMGGTAPAVCVASRAMLLSGQTLFRADERLTAEVTGRGRKGPFHLLPEHFRRHRYYTFGTGKWHNRAPLFARSFSGGANILMGGGSDPYRTPLHDFQPSGFYAAKPDRVGNGHASELFTDAAVRFLDQHDRQQPFFLYLAYTAPHDPRVAPESFRRMYAPDRLPLPTNFLTEHPFDNGELRIRDEMLAPFPRTPRDVRRHLADYYAMISHMDSQIGRVRDALRRNRFHSNTIVVFASDNGLAVGQHGLFGKQNLYDHSVRVPLMWSGPGIPRGRRSDMLCYLMDVFPTLCDLCGIPRAEHLEGRSLAPAIAGGRTEARSSLLLAYRDFQRGVTTGEWKMIRYKTKGDVHLFHLKSDPLEMRNLASSAEGAARLLEMDRLLRNWMEVTGDPELESKT